MAGLRLVFVAAPDECTRAQARLHAETFRMSLFDINCSIEFGSATTVVLIA
jgi:hypothetical protein